MMNIFHRMMKPREVIAGASKGWSLTWAKKKLPSGGATTYAFESYGTPLYDFVVGNGATFIRRPLLETQPAQWTNFTSPIVEASNLFQGQFATQPLVDPTTAQALGLTVEGAIPPDAYSMLPPAAPVLAP